MARAALAEKVVLAPGNVVSVTQTSSGYLRFDVAKLVDARVYDVLSRALLNASPFGHQIVASEPSKATANSRMR
jgi:hypothetical protein